MTTATSTLYARARDGLGLLGRLVVNRAPTLEELAAAAAGSCGRIFKHGISAFDITPSSERAFRAFLRAVRKEKRCPAGHLETLITAAWALRGHGDHETAFEALSIWRDQYAESRWKETQQVLNLVEFIETLPTADLKMVAGEIVLAAMGQGSTAFSNPRFTRLLGGALSVPLREMG